MESCINDAIKHGFLQQVRFLIEYGHSVNERDELNRTPLINCSLIEDESWGAGLARLFIEKGAKITLRDKRGLNALHYACIYNRKQLVEVFLNALDFELTTVDKFGNAALHYAASIGSIDICNLLIDAHKRYHQPAEVANTRKETPLILAWKNGHIECGQLLVGRCGADLNHTDIDGTSAKIWLEQAEFKKKQHLEEFKIRESKNRPRTAMARLERLAQPRQIHNFNHVSPISLTSRNRRKYSNQKENTINTDPVQIVKSSQPSFYRPASHKDLRNKPEYVFQLSPADYFINQARYPMSNLPRTLSASHLHKVGSESGSNTWRDTVKGFFTSYDYQFSHSFCRGAIAPPENDTETNPDERGTSPTPTHASEIDAESVSSASKKTQTKKVSNAITAINKMHAAVEKGDKRKTSRQEKSLGGLARRVSLAPHEMTGLDSSSTESVNASKKFLKVLNKK